MGGKDGGDEMVGEVVMEGRDGGDEMVGEVVMGGRDGGDGREGGMVVMGEREGWWWWERGRDGGDGREEWRYLECFDGWSSWNRRKSVLHTKKNTTHTRTRDE